MTQLLALSQLKQVVTTIDEASAFSRRKGGDCINKVATLKQMLYTKLGFPDTEDREYKYGLVSWEKLNIAWFADPDPRKFSIFTFDYESLFCGFIVLLYMEENHKDVEQMLAYLQEVDIEDFYSELEGYTEYEYLYDNLRMYLEEFYTAKTNEEFSTEDIRTMLMSYVCFAEAIRCFLSGEELTAQYNRLVYSHSVQYVLNTFIEDHERLGMTRVALQKGGLRVLLYFYLVRQYSSEQETSLLFADLCFSNTMNNNSLELQYLEQELEHITCGTEAKDISYLYEEGIEPGEAAELQIKCGSHLYIFNVSFNETYLRDSEYLLTNLYQNYVGEEIR